ncbi:MAG TPA: FtsX-like permease family protein [Asanoa sp.]
MIGLGLRLTLATGREAAVRFVVIAGAVCLGVGLLLATAAGVEAANAQFTRDAWMNATPAPPGSSTTEHPWWLARRDYFDGRLIARVDVAATDPHALDVPGIPRLPAAGEFYASPNLAELIARTPADELGDRFPGRLVGTIGDDALASPGSLTAIVGDTVADLSASGTARQVGAIPTTAPSLPLAAVDLVLSVVAGGLLFPVLVFVGTATRLSAARREQRFAAMRLVGATPRQISVIAAVEAATAAAVGTAAGFGLFYALRGPIAAIPFTGMPFFPHDLTLHPLAIALVALGVPVGAAVAAWVALRRVRISPLGIVRRVTPRPPRPYRLIPLLAGIAELAFFIGRVPRSSNAQVAVFLPGLFLMMGGLIYAGPWLTMTGARLLARRASRPAALIAARRLSDNPQAGFRAISGVVLALFVTSVATGVITTIVANRGGDRGGLAATSLVTSFNPPTASVPASIPARLRTIPGVRSTTVVRANPARDTAQMPALVSCVDLAKAPEYGRCTPGAEVAQAWSDLVGVFADRSAGRGSDTVWPPASVGVTQLDRLEVAAIVVGTDGSPAALERARTLLEVAYPNAWPPPATQDDFGVDVTTQLAGFRRLADVVILASLPIAGCGLAVSVVGGLTDRKRPFSLLRLAGVQLGVLRRVVALESAVPLLVVSVVAMALGLLGAQLFLRAQMDYALRLPGPSYYLIVLAGLALTLGIIASTLPLLRRITGPETARNE